MIRRGDIRWYRFARPDKLRPVLVLTRDSIIDLLGELTVAPVTTTIRGIPSEVPLGKIDGIARECAVNLDHLQTVQKARLDGLITTLGTPRLEEVRAALLFALGFR